VHDIQIGKTYRQNKGIVVHDSGGIEGGDDVAVQAVTNFLQAHNNAKYLKDQIHCIWYLILSKCFIFGGLLTAHN
jgi:hypothetical protein